MIYETYSQRQDLAAKNDDVFQYNEVPERLRVQLQQILIDALGPHHRMTEFAMHAPIDNADTWQFIHKTICREFGLNSLGRGATEGQQVIGYLATCSATEFVDIVEICVRAIDRVVRRWSAYDRKSHGIEQDSQEALDEINYRFRRSSFGFQFIDGLAMRVDSEFLHEEVIKPALRILNRAGFEGAREEFLAAHRHYRNGDLKEAITEAAKSFESVMKAICDQKGWIYPKGARASDLLKIIRANHLWPEYLDSSFDQLVATLVSGLPKIRNDNGAHGQGSVSRQTPNYVAAYAIHLAASKIVLMTEAAAESGTDENTGQP